MEKEGHGLGHPILHDLMRSHGALPKVAQRLKTFAHGPGSGPFGPERAPTQTLNVAGKDCMGAPQAVTI